MSVSTRTLARACLALAAAAMALSSAAAFDPFKGELPLLKDVAGGGQAACNSRPTLTCYLATTQSVDTEGKPSKVTGKVDFKPTYDGSKCMTKITGTISGFGNGNPHGWHVHAKGDISDPKGLATGDHFNPFNAPHGIPTIDKSVHAGDLGNFTPDANGVATISLESAVNTKLILGRGLIVHAAKDQGSAFQPVGNSGARLAQCVLGRTDTDGAF